MIKPSEVLKERIEELEAEFKQFEYMKLRAEGVREKLKCELRIAENRAAFRYLKMELKEVEKTEGLIEDLKCMLREKELNIPKIMQMSNKLFERYTEGRASKI